ncbi:DUF4340 domain-containing protein [Luteolibacter sp. SL250]|uniref:DUF4340 domain-containing protein n=1 Tax=Luteolibacter sp. SL250 TaxID=2995170 RepID=UPI00226E6514|nr:DUF4340 domain-containing protein [Luteolibacter sp. SL250]WAC18774.1 DUF4340 domain-containing protein [Luteolibacter sp. SL250]
MRSFSFTVFLALSAVVICGVIGWQLKEGNLDAILGVPPVQPGEHLYSGFRPDDVTKISVESGGIHLEYAKQDGIWKSTTPPHDRMDPKAAAGLIGYTLGLKVTDHAPVDEIDRMEAGLREGNVQVELEDASGGSLARFRLGNRTPLLTENTVTGKPDANFYIQPRERGKKDHIYACPGDITDLFKDGMRHLRDHHPFYVNPLSLQKIRLRTDQGELTLGRELPTADTPNQPWRIVKPLELRTDRDRIVALLEGIVQLTATKVVDRSSVTLPSVDPTSKPFQIAVTPYGQEKETLLEIYPPETADATEALATVSDRPDTVFHLPRKAGPGSLANLPVTVNELRDRALTHLNIAGVRAISITPLTGSRILLSIDPPRPWQVEINGEKQDANEQRLFALLKMLGTKATGIESDAAPDLSQWGLDKPFLVIEVIDGNNQTLRLNFGMDQQGGVFVNRQGTPTVMRVERSILSSISIQPHEWRHALLWSIAGVDLESVQRTVRTEPPLDLTYNDAMETWRGSIAGTDVTPRIEPAKAKAMLNAILAVYVSRWLPLADPAAEAALANPVFTLTTSEIQVDELGDDTGERKRRTLTLAPMTDSADYYGRLSGEPHPFVIDRDTAFKLGIDPLEKAQP